MKGEALVCSAHEGNYFVGGCISCTYNEMRRYQALYETAREILRNQRAANSAVKEADWAMGRFVEAANSGAHDVMWAESVS